MSKLSALLESLPEPPKENLSSHFILGEIIDHIHVLQDDFPHVKIPLLRSHLWSIRNKSVEPEDHLRGFLHVFEHTDVFKDAFEQLDDGMKRQLKVFMVGGKEGQIMASGTQLDAFALPPSPPVKNHFKEIIEKIEEFFHHEHHTNGVSGINGVNGVNGHSEKKVAIKQEGFPRIFEDKAETKTMEVRILVFPSFELAGSHKSSEISITNLSLECEVLFLSMNLDLWNLGL
jgi:hypothetical protein